MCAQHEQIRKTKIPDSIGILKWHRIEIEEFCHSLNVIIEAKSRTRIEKIASTECTSIEKKKTNWQWNIGGFYSKHSVEWQKKRITIMKSVRIIWVFDILTKIQLYFVMEEIFSYVSSIVLSTSLFDHCSNCSVNQWNNRHRQVSYP